MTKEQALKLLETAPRFDMASHLNPRLSMSEAVDIAIRAVKSHMDGQELPHLIAERVNQVCNPVYTIRIQPELKAQP